MATAGLVREWKTDGKYYELEVRLRVKQQPLVKASFERAVRRLGMYKGVFGRVSKEKSLDFSLEKQGEEAVRVTRFLDGRPMKAMQKVGAVV